MLFYFILFFKASNLTENTIFVADTGNDRVAMFSENGNFTPPYLAMDEQKTILLTFFWIAAEKTETAPIKLLLQIR